MYGFGGAFNPPRPGGNGGGAVPAPGNAGNTLTVRIPGVPFPLAFADWVHDRFFGTVEFGNADTEALSAFIGTVGATIQGGTRTMTQVDINLPRSGENGLPQGYEMLAYSLQAEIVRVIYSAGAIALSSSSFLANVDTLHDIQRKVFVDFRYNNKSISQGRLGSYPQGGGLHVVTQRSAAEYAQNSAIDPRGALAFVIPLWLRPDVSFTCKLTPVIALSLAQSVTVSGVAQTANTIDLQMTLVGLVKRPVS